VAATGSSEPLSVDPAASGLHEAKIDLPAAPASLALAGEWLWAISPSTDELYLIDHPNGALVTSTAVCDLPSGVAAETDRASIGCARRLAVLDRVATMITNSVPCWRDGRAWEALRR
jgi:hypothetical protein